MKNIVISAFLAIAALSAPGVASADDVSDRSAAIGLCRAEINAQTGLGADEVRFDQVRVRPRVVRVDFDVWRDGRLQNVRCEVDRGANLTIAAITPALQTASAAANAGQ
jgi:hypothetical protein